MKEKILLFFIIFVFSFLSLICADNIKSGEALTSEITPNRAGIKCIQYEKTEVIVSLKDGSKFKGKILREDLLTITLKSILGEITIHRSDILEIEYIQKEREIYPSLSIKER